MTLSDIPIGAIFQVVGSEELWLKATDRHCRNLGEEGWKAHSFRFFAKKPVEIVKQPETGPIRRVGDVLFLSDGDVQLEYLYPWLVRRCEPGELLTRFVLHGHTFETSVVNAPSEDTALPFTIRHGGKHFGRPSSSMLFAYKGRVFARATIQEVRGPSARNSGGYKDFVREDGARRLVIAGALTLPEEGALHDIIQDHFGPGAPFR
jgi:hypothetical protein